MTMMLRHRMETAAVIALMIIMMMSSFKGIQCFQGTTSTLRSSSLLLRVHTTIPESSSRLFATDLNKKETSSPSSDTNDKEGEGEGEELKSASEFEDMTKQQQAGVSEKPCPCAYVEKPNYADGTKPESAFLLGTKNFVKQGSTMVEEGLAQIGITSKNYVSLDCKPPNCLGFTLDDVAVHEAERRRESQMGGKVETNPVARKLYEIGCWALDELFPGRPIPRFWFLETIARMPYFSYVSMLHLYESFGWWRDPQLRKVHNAEEYNELHHLLIMESLGGNALWRDRFLGYHVAIGYYWAICALFAFSPKAAYGFMALLESHAVDTYSTFFKENEERLKALPAPAIATSYYNGADPYLFDDFQVSRKPRTRRPPCDTLYDVFKNISEDEAEHVKTMKACMVYSLVGDIVVSPHMNDDANWIVSDIDAQRQAWLDWSEEVNRACTAEEDF